LAESGLSAVGEGNGEADHDLKLRFEANVFRRKLRALGIILAHNNPSSYPSARSIMVAGQTIDASAVYQFVAPPS